MTKITDLPDEIIKYIFKIAKHKNKKFLGLSCINPKCIIGNNNNCIFNIIEYKLKIKYL